MLMGLLTLVTFVCCVLTAFDDTVPSSNSQPNPSLSTQQHTKPKRSIRKPVQVKRVSHSSNCYLVLAYLFDDLYHIQPFLHLQFNQLHDVSVGTGGKSQTSHYARLPSPPLILSPPCHTPHEVAPTPSLVSHPHASPDLDAVCVDLSSYSLQLLPAGGYLSTVPFFTLVPPSSSLPSLIPNSFSITSSAGEVNKPSISQVSLLKQAEVGYLIVKPGYVFPNQNI